MTVNSTTLVVSTRQDQHSIIRRQVTLTQTITYPDSTTTAVVTLDRGGPSTTSPAPSWSPGATSSDGLGQQQIGIIVGCCIGAVVLGIILWCCCTNRCGCTPYSVYEPPETDSNEYIYEETAEITRPPISYWPKFPRSISPPVIPDYVATDSAPQWTAYEASRRRRPTYYGGLW